MLAQHAVLVVKISLVLLTFCASARNMPVSAAYLKGSGYVRSDWSFVSQATTWRLMSPRAMGFRQAGPRLCRQRVTIPLGT